MIFRAPSYYYDFHCIADKCKDNCCIGWEIDIDDITLEKYLSLGGSFGERLRSSISMENPSFIPDKSGRCPFLNKDNLCDIILSSGEDFLCDVCNNHPRYFEWFGDVKEGGIGLSCEESARIILSSPFSLTEKEIKDEETEYPDDERDFKLLLSAREKIIAYLSDENIPLENALSDIYEYAFKVEDYHINGYYTIPEIKHTGEKLSFDINKNLDFLLTLEKLSPEWEPYILSMKEKINDEDFFIRETEKYLRNIAIYFVFRYFLKSCYDGDIIPYINLMTMSVFILAFLFSKGDLSLKNCSEIAKNFSKEIEYSEENLEALSFETLS
ncbi:MAG: flagellin lysine-N-methylase [Oscillospiraceae bacterium]|nr:flagellin lysine-N-methylase [Oscillospiraceae bacterium]